MYASHFSIENIPYGIASSQVHPKKSLVTRLENDVIFLDELVHLHPPFLSVNDFAALSRSEHTATRKWLQSILAKSGSNLPTPCISPVESTTLYLPVAVGDFTDFSCSNNHVLNAGEAVFGKRELPPGFEHFPVGYHGRTSSIVVSGTSVVRPKGQYREGSKGDIVFGATKRLDYELEIAAVIGKSSVLGSPISIENADDHIFGLVLLNDWSGEKPSP